MLFKGWGCNDGDFLYIYKNYVLFQKLSKYLNKVIF